MYNCYIAYLNKLCFVILQTVLMEYGWVWWMDSSVRFKTSDLDPALDYSKKHSLLFFTYDVAFAVAQHTDIQTMNYLQEDRCKFRHFGEVEATFVLYHFDDVTKTLVDAWTSCALNKACMSPPGTASKLGCNVNNQSDGRCHRFDQAVLSIMLRRLYHKQNDYPLVDEPFHIHEVRRGQSMNFLSRLWSRCLNWRHVHMLKSHFFDLYFDFQLFSNYSVFHLLCNVDVDVCDVFIYRVPFVHYKCSVVVFNLHLCSTLYVCIRIVQLIRLSILLCIHR